MRDGKVFAEGLHMLTGLTVSGTTGPERYRFGRVGQRLEKCLAMIEWYNAVVAPVNDVDRTPVPNETKLKSEE